MAAEEPIDHPKRGRLRTRPPRVVGRSASAAEPAAEDPAARAALSRIAWETGRAPRPGTGYQNRDGSVTQLGHDGVARTYSKAAWDELHPTTTRPRQQESAPRYGDLAYLHVVLPNGDVVERAFRSVSRGGLTTAEPSRPLRPNDISFWTAYGRTGRAPAGARVVGSGPDGPTTVYLPASRTHRGPYGRTTATPSEQRTGHAGSQAARLR